MTKRGEIVAEIKNLLKNISQSNGYNTDIGQNIQEWRVSAVETILLPVVIIEDKEEIFSEENSIIGKKDRILNISIKILADVDNIEDLRAMVEDVFVCLGANENLSGKVQDMDVNSVEIDVEQNKERLAMASISLSVKFMSERWEF